MRRAGPASTARDGRAVNGGQTPFEGGSTDAGSFTAVGESVRHWSTGCVPHDPLAGRRAPDDAQERADGQATLNILLVKLRKAMREVRMVSRPPGRRCGGQT